MIQILKPYIDFAVGLLAKLGIRKSTIIIFRRDTRNPIPKIRTRIGFDIKIVDKQDLYELAKLQPESEMRFERGDIGFVARSDGKIAGYIWVNLKGRAYVEEIERDHEFGPGGYIYDGRCEPEFRRNSLHKKLIELNMRYLRDAGFRDFYTITTKANIVSQKTLKNFDCVPVRKVRYIRIFSYRRWKET